MNTNCLAFFGISLGLIFGWHTFAQAANSYNFNCRSGYVLVGVIGNQGSWMNGAAGRCAKVKPDGAIDGARDRKSIKKTKWAGGKKAVGTAGNRTRVVDCPANMVMVGFTGTRGNASFGANYVNTIRSITCQGWNKAKRIAFGRVTNVTAFPKRGPGGYTQTLCKGGAVGLGIRGKHGIYLDSFKVKCGLAPGAKR